MPWARCRSNASTKKTWRDQRIILDSGNRYVREQFEHLAGEDDVRLRRLLRRLSVDQIEIQTDRSYVPPLIDFFRARERKLSR